MPRTEVAYSRADFVFYFLGLKMYIHISLKAGCAALLAVQTLHPCKNLTYRINLLTLSIGFAFLTGGRFQAHSDMLPVGLAKVLS